MHAGKGTTALTPSSMNVLQELTIPFWQLQVPPTVCKSQRVTIHPRQHQPLMSKICAKEGITALLAQLQAPFTYAQLVTTEAFLVLESLKIALNAQPDTTAQIRRWNLLYVQLDIIAQTALNSQFLVLLERLAQARA